MARGLLICWSVHHFGPDRNIATNMRWSTMKLGTDVQRMHLNDFDLATFLLASPVTYCEKCIEMQMD